MRRSHTLLVTIVIYVITSVALLSYLKKIPIRMKFVETTPSNEFTGHFSIYRDATLPMGGYTYMPLSNASSSCHSYGVDGTSGRNQTKSKVFLTIFTTWDSNDKKDQVHANTLLNWQSLKGDIRVIVFINDSLNNFPLCTCPDCELWPAPVVGESGVPVLKHMFMYVTRNVNSTYYSYVNSDIVFNNNLIRTLQIIEARVNFAIRPAFIVGRRTNVINLTADEAASSKNLEQAARSRGKLFRTDAQDYFITTRNYPWENIPSLIVGSPGYDNWLVTYSLISRFVVIDATATVLAVHQTTSIGNYEGFQKTFKNYNVKLLASKYNDSKSVLAGHTICTDLQTKFLKGKIILLERRSNICRRIHKKIIGRKPIKTPWNS